MESPPEFSSLSLSYASAVAVLVIVVFLFVPAITHREEKPSFPHKEASIIFVGDIMLGRRVETLTNTYGPNYPFEKVSSFLDHYPNVGNLEGSIVSTSTHLQTPELGFRFSFAPTTASILAQHGFFYLSLANNHGVDQGEAGWQSTRELLAKQYIQSFGHPIRINEAESLSRLKIGGVPIAMLGINATFPNFIQDSAINLISNTCPESSQMRDASENQTELYENTAKEDRSLQQSRWDFQTCIVFMHWGDEYKLHSNTFQQNLAHKMIDAGADIVIGSHPHVVQEVEEYKGKLIFYSLGNFIFDQYFSTDVEQGLALKMWVDLEDSQISKIELFPIQSSKSQPALMEGRAKLSFLDSLAARSDHQLYNSIVEGIIVTSPGN